MALGMWSPRGAAITTLALLGGMWMAMARPVAAAPGELDPSFGGTGMVRTDFGGGRGAASAVVVQPDGKKVLTDFGGQDEAYGMTIQPDGQIIAVGWGALQFSLARYQSQ